MSSRRTPVSQEGGSASCEHTGRNLATDLHGQAVLFLVIIALLGGKFTLDRVSPDLPAYDLRWVGLAVVGLCFGLWAAAAGGRMPRPDRLGPGCFWFFAWLGWMAVSSLWSGPMARTETNLIDLGYLAALVLMGWEVARRLSREALSVVWIWLPLIGGLYFVGALVAGPDVQGRFSAFGGGPNVFVRVMLLGALGAVFLAAKRNRLRWLLTLPVFLTGAVLSGSRGGLLSFAAVILVGGFPMLRRLPRGTAALAVAGIVAVVALAPVLVGSVVQQTLSRRYLQETLEQRYDSGRGEIVAQSLEIFRSHLFFGAGLDGYYAEVGHVVGFEYPHNLLLASAAEGGLVGLVLVVVALLAFVRTATRSRPVSKEGLFLVLAGGFILLSSLFSGDYYDSRMMWLFLGFAAIEGARRRPARSRPDPQT